MKCKIYKFNLDAATELCTLLQTCNWNYFTSTDEIN